jgi:hypothetical protein
MRLNSIDPKDGPVRDAGTWFVRRGTLAAMAVGLVLVLATSGTLTVSADGDGPKTCSNRTLRGDYGSAIDGSIPLPSPAPSLLLHGLVMQRFDGRGNFTQVDFITLNGAPEFSDWRPATGTYSVNPDCTGTQVINFNDGSPSLNLRLVVVDGGRQILALVEGIPTAAIGFRVR